MKIHPAFWVVGIVTCLTTLTEKEKVKKVFISFDFDNDSFLKDALVGQAKNPDTPFKIHDQSLKEPLAGDWKTKIRPRIANADIVVVMCGQKTHTASGVAAELQIAQELNKPYFLLKGYSDKKCTFPTTAASQDKMYNWTWDNLKKLIGGAR
ncbi:TIR domain-containing protein [Bdellovibrio bacteriovorus]|uniref:TIR domain-containing protein n=1 Tax=Bdellovibrio bacteriovorus TaxID=959 RepID=UPI0035A5CEC5